MHISNTCLCCTIFRGSIGRAAWRPVHQKMVDHKCKIFTRLLHLSDNPKIQQLRRENTFDGRQQIKLKHTGMRPQASVLLCRTHTQPSSALWIGRAGSPLHRSPPCTSLHPSISLPFIPATAHRLGLCPAYWDQNQPRKPQNASHMPVSSPTHQRSAQRTSIIRQSWRLQPPWRP